MSHFIVLIALLPLPALAQISNNIVSKAGGFLDSSMLVFLLAIVVIAVEGFIIKTTKYYWTPYSVIRLIGLTIIVFATLILALEPDLREQRLAHVIGLMGAIAGYLLGKDSREQDKSTAIDVDEAKQETADKKDKTSKDIPPPE